MSNYIDTKAEIENYLSAHIPLIIIQSQERERVERILRELNEDRLEKMYYYTDSGQVVRMGSNSGARDEVTEGIMKYVYDKFKQQKHCVFAIGDARHLEDSNLFTKDVLDVLYKAKEKECTLILITSDPVWSRLTRFGMITTLDYPDLQERIDRINRFIADNLIPEKTDYLQKKINLFRKIEKKPKSYVEWNEEDVVRAATLLRGFSEIQIDNILVTLLKKKKTLKAEDISELTEQKSRLYSSVPTVEHVIVKPELKSAGMLGLKQWLKENRKLFFMSEASLSERDLEAPKGILLAGVPGCGKSLSAKIIAQEWELPLFRFDIGSIYDKWMGNSEKRMQDALTFIDNVAPCILWIDEIEKALSASDAGNDTSQRILGQLLFWLQESTSRVFLVATANDIQKLPPELYRKGRFSELFFVDIPNESEREEVIRLYIKRSLLIDPDTLNIRSLVNSSEGFSCADIEQCIKDVARMALCQGQDIITQRFLEDKFKNTVSISKSNPEIIKNLQEWGREKAVSASGGGI